MQIHCWLKQVIRENQQELACIITEPIPCNMGVVPPEPGFLEALRQLTTAHGILLIFDEVITGFRTRLGGVQSRFGITPDLTILGKIIGGGLPVGAFGGRREIMDCLAPDGDVYQAGTLSGNPLAMQAGCAVLDWLQEHAAIYQQMETMVNDFTNAFRKQSSLVINQYATFFTIFFREKPVTAFQDALQQDSHLFKNYFQKALAQKLLLPPSMYETAFLSTEHTARDLEKLLRVFASE